MTLLLTTAKPHLQNELIGQFAQLKLLNDPNLFGNLNKLKPKIIDFALTKSLVC